MMPRSPQRQGPPRLLVVAIGLALLLIFSRGIASLVIEVEWWKEINLFSTFETMLLYRYLPVLIATVVAFAILWIAHARGLKSAGTGLSRHPLYASASTLVLLFLSFVIARSSLDPWTLVSYLGSVRAGLTAGSWRDPIFGNGLEFYFFLLPFVSELLGFLVAVAFAAAAAYWFAARFMTLAQLLQERQGENFILEARDVFGSTLESKLFRSLVAILLLGVAARVILHRYSYLADDHGFLVGVDWVAANIRIPLLWLVAAALVVSAGLVMAGRYKLAMAPAVVLLLPLVLPPLISAVYVSPNELSLQTPYIQNHIQGTRSAWALDGRLTEVQYPATLEAAIPAGRNRALLDNVRLWDWRAFLDTTTQIQALRQYYVFNDTDVDRYTLGGSLKQVMVAPRELDINQLPDARANWINGHFIYTHGYGLVMAEASKITPNGQPVLMIQDAPPKVQTPELKLSRPELYFGEITHEPVFVRSKQPEFNYPSGTENVQTRYEGKGGIPIGNLPMRLAAAVFYGDRNLLLTDLLNSDSRMLIRRDVRERLRSVAEFIEWDRDPYLVVTKEGRLVWMVDGYTSSSQHPYSRRVQIRDFGTVNYLRNSVKAVVDAYDGSMSFYIFEPNDPIVRAFQAMFPAMFQPSSAMPAELRDHARYAELMFRSQAEIYRTFHMTDPEAFYNREDLWDVAMQMSSADRTQETAAPTFLVATLPGETQPEYLLVLPFTPRSKDNLIGLMLARSDGGKLGEIVVLQLSKQSLIYGPRQIDARIDSDQLISKDLSLWNQQGSQVIRGQMLVLPVEQTFVYVEPIYIQSAQAKMPQLRKVVVGMGNRLIYKDTYEEAINELTGSLPAAAGEPPPPVLTSGANPPPAPAPVKTDVGRGLESVRGHLRRYRELSSQGRWSEAGRELEAIEKLVSP